MSGSKLPWTRLAFSLVMREISGDHSGGETPVPIPNTAVKPTSADGTALATGWESRSLPGISLLFSASGAVLYSKPSRYLQGRLCSTPHTTGTLHRDLGPGAYGSSFRFQITAEDFNRRVTA